MNNLFRCKQITKLLFFVLPFSVIAETDYEPNNSRINATPINIGIGHTDTTENYPYSSYPQSHTFNAVNDEDWFVFETGTFDSENHHTTPIFISTDSSSSNTTTQPSLELYDAKGHFIIGSDDFDLAAYDSYFSSEELRQGKAFLPFRYLANEEVYYIRVRNSETVFDQDNEYVINVTTVEWDFSDPHDSGYLSGEVIDHCTKAPINNASFGQDTQGAVLSANGGKYGMTVLKGAKNITANKPGYEKLTKTITVAEFEQITLDFELIPDTGCSDTSVTPVTPVTPENILNTARYNALTKTLIIDDVVYESDHYQAELADYGDFTFNLKSASKLEGQTLQNQNIFDLTTSSLKLNKVFAFGKHYKVVLKHLGDFVFKLESAKEISE